MPSGNVDVRIHDTDEVTWATLEKAFPVKRSGAEGSTTWIVVVDAETGIRLTFFKASDPAEWDEDDAHGSDCATHGSSASECTCGKADALAEASV